MDHGDLAHRLTRLGVGLTIFAQAPVAREPSPWAFPDPARRDGHNALEGVAAFRDLQGTRPLRPPGPAPVHQRSGRGAIRPDGPEPPRLVSEAVEPPLRPRAILDVGGRHHHRKEQAEGLDEAMPLAAFDLCARLVPAAPPGSVVLTD